MKKIILKKFISWISKRASELGRTKNIISSLKTLKMFTSPLDLFSYFVCNIFLCSVSMELKAHFKLDEFIRIPCIPAFRYFSMSNLRTKTALDFFKFDATYTQAHAILTYIFIFLSKAMVEYDFWGSSTGNFRFFHMHRKYAQSDTAAEWHRRVRAFQDVKMALAFQDRNGHAR